MKQLKNTSEYARELWGRIKRADEEYKRWVLALSDNDLKDHCFGDGDWEVDDFCVQEYIKRGLQLPK